MAGLAGAMLALVAGALAPAGAVLTAGAAVIDVSAAEAGRMAEWALVTLMLVVRSTDLGQMFGSVLTGGSYGRLQDGPGQHHARELEPRTHGAVTSFQGDQRRALRAGRRQG